jgi:oxygen-independent coproporphyrinogen-3 oxidase
MPTPIRHLYLHVPFCHRICPYCSFYKHTPGATDQTAFLQALVAEARMARQLWGDRIQLDTIYWGGGTPSLLSTEHLNSFLPELLAALNHPQPSEWTVEMNPMTLTKAKLELFRQHGVTRASLGVQAWDETTLTTLGRDHSPDQAEASFQLLRAVNFPIVSLDLMFSIPGQSLETWIASLDRTISLQPDHISCYNLTYEEDTDFFEKFSAGTYQRDEATDEAFFLETMQRLPQADFQQYEISNYACPGFESRHNQAYWAGADYLGLGPSAVSTIDRVRTKNVPDTAAYISQLGKQQSPTQEAEHLTDEQWRCERLALELRTARGLPRHWLADESAKLEQLTTEGLLTCTETTIKLTQKGKLVADGIVAHLWT